LSRYAVKFWNQGMHQDSTIMKVGQEDPLDPSYYIPLVICIAGFVLLFVTLLLLRTRTEIRARRLKALEQRERMA
jgi:heme exporter protein C